ncbi:MAG TPA: DUF262 domain-containing protein [Gammaproteobacteria bacterium]|nr:DUF262 domain-containing protein [Gammaproteobacteria bacterium]
MREAQKPDHVSLNSLIHRLKEGRFVIPDFQREFEWKPWDIRDLMRSIFLDYYIGSLLLWKGKPENFQALSCEPVYGFQGEGNPEHIVLDGQQRLTAIYYAFLAPDVPLPNRANRAFYYIRVNKFMEEAYDEAFNYDWRSRRWSGVLSNWESQYEMHIFPLFIVGAGGWDLPNWVQGYERFWREQTDQAREEGQIEKAKLYAIHAENARAFGQHIKEITELYQISYIELDKDIAVDKVCDIFTQINSKGVQLDVFDLINALLKPKGLQLKHMWRRAAKRLEFVDSPKMNVYILQVMSVLRQVYCSPKYLYYLLPGQPRIIRNPDGTKRKEILVPDSADFERRWNEAVDALEYAINLLRHPQEFGVTSSKYLPYVSILPAFASLQHRVRQLPPEKQYDAQRKVRKWYWASVFTNRYSGSVESTTARDFLDVTHWFDDNEAEPALMEEFRNRFRNLDLRKEVKRGTSIYNGIFNLFVIRGARDWMTGNIPQEEVDDHHIVPAEWGKKHLEGNLIHTILNRTPLTAHTNRQVIGNQLPNQYLPRMIEQNGEARVRQIMDSHFISPEAIEVLLRDPFTPEDFQAFIAERQRAILAAIEDMLIEDRMPLSPRLREIDKRIEQIELTLRELIVSKLHNDPSLIPPHIQQKARERIEKAARKNAVFSMEQYRDLQGQLEFYDLRELQALITHKSLWPRFESIFKNKNVLNTRFDQLAELRNSIRHSRTVDEITAIDGEAAMKWFQRVLNLSFES